MPRTSSQKTSRSARLGVMARDLSTDRREKVVPSKDNINKFKDVCKTKRHVLPPKPEFKPPVLSLQDRLEIAEEFEKHTKTLREIHRLHTRIGQLEKTKSRQPSLLERIEGPSTTSSSSTYTPPAPLPAVKFRKAHLIKRQEEFKEMVWICTAKYRPIFGYIAEHKHRLQEKGVYTYEAQNMCRYFNRMQDRFKNMRVKFDEDGSMDRMTNKEWRKLRIDLRRLEKVQTDGLAAELNVMSEFVTFLQEVSRM
jgi:hypothetical protein